MAFRVKEVGLRFAVTMLSLRVELYNGNGSLLWSTSCNRLVSEAAVFCMSSEMKEAPVLLIDL